MGHILAEQVSRGVQTSGYEKKFSKNTSLNAVHAATGANTDRTQRCIQYASMARLETFRWSRFTLLSDPVPKLLRMKVHVFSYSTLRAWISSPDPSNSYEDSINKLNLAARDVQFTWHAGVQTFTTKLWCAFDTFVITTFPILHQIEQWPFGIQRMQSPLSELFLALVVPFLFAFPLHAVLSSSRFLAFKV